MRAALALVLLSVSLGGCLKDFEEPHFLRLAGLDIAPERVLAQDVILNVTPVIENVGRGDSDEVRVIAKAYSEDTGFLLAENETSAGIVPAESSRTVSQFLRVPRQGSVRVEISFAEDERITKAGALSARNLAALEPEALDTGLRVSDIDFLVRDVNQTRVTVQADLYLTNEGEAPSENLRVQVKAREISTGIISDIQWSETGVIAPGTTIVRSVNLTVPERYNYVFEIITWRGDVVVARSEGNVQLAPTFEKPKDTELVVTNPNLNDFRMTTSTPGYPGYYGATPTPQVPGFGAVAALAAACLAAVLVLRRRS